MENATAKKTVNKFNYGFSREVPLDFNEAVERTREILKKEGFGVLSEIRMDEKFKDKLGVDFRKYLILGACNPPLAYKAVQEDINIGLLLPCSVVVYEANEVGKSVVAAINAKTMMSVAGEGPAMEAASTEVSERLALVVEKV